MGDEWYFSEQLTIFHSLICSIISEEIVLNVATGFCICLRPSVTGLLHRHYREIFLLRGQHDWSWLVWLTETEDYLAHVLGSEGCCTATLISVVLTDML